MSGTALTITIVIVRTGSGNPNVVKYVLLLGNFTFQNFFSFQSGCTALQVAAAEGHLEIVKQLIKHGADVNKQDTVVITINTFAYLL